MRSIFEKSLTWTVILSETSHVFCCVFPTLFSLAGLLAGLGMTAALPSSMIHLHDTMHRWEIPMIGFSGVILALGWAAALYSARVDCHNTGCAHGECSSDKSEVHIVLKIATALFIFNVGVFAFVHRSGFFGS